MNDLSGSPNTPRRPTASVFKMMSKKNSSTGSTFMSNITNTIGSSTLSLTAGAELFDGLTGSLWTCVVTMAEDLLTTAGNHAAIASKIHDSVVRPYEENLGLVGEQVKLNVEVGKKNELSKKSGT